MAPPTGRSTHLERSLASVVLAGVLVVPLVFTTAYDDVFVLPKVVTLGVVVSMAVATVIIGLLRGWALPKERLEVADRLVIAFFVVNVMAFAFSVDRSQSLLGEPLQYQGLLSLVLYLGLYALARVSFGTQRSVGLLFGVATLAAALVAGYALLQRVGLDPIWDVLPHGRVFSSIGQANALAAYLAMAVPLAVAVATRVRWMGRLVVFAVVALMITALAFTFSRGGYAGLVAGGAVLAIPIVGAIRSAGRRTMAVAVGAALLAAVLIMTVGPVRQTVAAVGSRALTSFDIDEPGSVRMHLDKWIVATRIAADYPFLGAGQETYPDLFPAYGHAYLPTERATAFDYYRVESPHNVYLATAAGAGWPAMAIHLAFIGVIGVSLTREIRSTPGGSRRWLLFGLLAAITAHVVTDFFMTAEPTGSALFWIVLGVAVAQTRVRASKPDDIATPPEARYVVTP